MGALSTYPAVEQAVGNSKVTSLLLPPPGSAALSKFCVVLQWWQDECWLH